MHLVETMAYKGEKPWHGLGSEMQPGQSIDAWRINSGLNFEVREASVQYQSFTDTRGYAPSTFDDQKVLYRSDTGAPLSVVSKRYHVVQPKDVIEFYRDLTEVSGFELETAGVLKGGRKIWALARTGQSTALRGNDVMNGYLLLATACDGTLATTAQFTSVRVVCNNTLTVALDGRPSAVKVPHSTTFDPVAVKRQLGVCVSAWDEFMYRMKVLSDRRVGYVEAERFFQHLSTPHDVPTKGPGQERAVKRLVELYSGAGKGSTLSSSYNTAFGLLNAVTEYVDHERRSRNPDNRLDSAWFGVGAALKKKALDQALALAS